MKKNSANFSTARACFRSSSASGVTGCSTSSGRTVSTPLCQDRCQLLKEDATSILTQGASEPLQVHRVRLRRGITEGLVTSLRDEPRYPTRLFAARYSQRWSTEEHGKRAQRWAELESFSGLSPLVIEQDFHANILALNLAAMHRVMAEAVARRYFVHRRHTIQVRRTHVLSAMKNTLLHFLLHTGPVVADLGCRLITPLAGAIEGIRPDRTFPRHPPGQLKIGPHMRYKRTA